LRYLPALLIGRLVRLAVRLVRPGGGSALPGLVVSKIAPNLTFKTLSSFKDGLVVITGTAGKSTTTKMVVAIVRAHGRSVFTNPSTANIEQGFFSTIVRHGDLFGNVPGQIAILEMDEGHAAQLTKRVSPRISVILNVFEDQLDRFIDPTLVREKLREVASNTHQRVLLNADDQNCLLIGNEIDNAKAYFGLSDAIRLLPEHDMPYAPTYLEHQARPSVSSVALELSGQNLSVQVGPDKTSFELPSRGVHFALDAIAALATAKEVLGADFDLSLAANVLNDLPPVFSRGEVREINGEKVEFILVQNPISLQLNLDNLIGAPEQILFAIGRDVHDPSWMWTVDFSNLQKVSVVSGFNYADAALLLAYNEIPVERVEADYFKAIEDFLELPKPIFGIKTVIYSADAMRRLRRHLGFTDPEDVERV